MNPVELFHKDGKPAGIWYCSKCRHVAVNQAMGERCCEVHICKFCNKPVEEKHWLSHPECAREAREKEAVAAAARVFDTDCWVYVDGLGDEYFPSVGELLEYCDTEEIEVPEYAWQCKMVPFKVMDIGNILEHSCTDAWDGMETHITGAPELEAALEVFRKANEDLVSWEVERKVMVMIRATPVHQLLA